MRRFILLLAVGVSICTATEAAPLITVVKQGAEKNSVTLSGLAASGVNGKLFVQTLERDLEISGWFKVGPTGAVKVQGQVAEAGMGIQSRCVVSWPGKKFDWAKVSAGQAEVRKQAHLLADEMVRLMLREAVRTVRNRPHG